MHRMAARVRAHQPECLKVGRVRDAGLRRSSFETGSQAADFQLEIFRSLSSHANAIDVALAPERSSGQLMAWCRLHVTGSP
jgi:hypothetical protein